MQTRKNLTLVVLLLTFCLAGTAQSATSPAKALQSTVNHKTDSLKKNHQVINRDAYRTARKHRYVKVLRLTNKMHKAQLAELTPIRTIKARTNSKASMRKALKSSLANTAKNTPNRNWL